MIARKFLIFVVCLSSVAVTVAAQGDDPVAQAVALFQQGQDVHEKGDLEGAVKLYSESLALLPAFPEAELQRGNAYLSLGNHQGAESSYRKALELRPEWSLAMASLGSLLVSQKKLDEAAPLLDRAIASDSMNSLALTAMSELLLERKAPLAELQDHLARLKVFEGKVRPTAGLLTSKAAIEEKLGLSIEAKESASRALQADPNSRAALIILAELALSENDIKKADGYVRDLLRVAPDLSDSLMLKARVLLAQGRKPEALAVLESIKEPGDAVKSLVAKLKDGSDATNLAALEETVSREPGNAGALAKLCVGYRVPNPMKALDFCRRASVLEPNEMSHAVNFAAALVQARKYEEAVGLLRKLLVLQPEHATIRANLATALFQLKLYPEAKAQFTWLSEKQPSSPISFYFLGIIHDHLKEYLDAMACYQQFLKLADSATHGLEIDKVNLRLPALQKQIKGGRSKKN